MKKRLIIENENDRFFMELESIENTKTKKVTCDIRIFDKNDNNRLILNMSQEEFISIRTLIDEIVKSELRGIK